MKKGLLLICSLIVALSTYSAIPQLTKSTPLTLTAASEGFSQSANAKALVDGEWIRVSGKLVLDDRIEAKKDMLDKNPQLRGMYNENDDNHLKLIYK